MSTQPIALLASRSSHACRTAFRRALLSLAFIASAATGAANSTHDPLITLTPREGAGLGTLSAYAGVAPVFIEGTETIKIPTEGQKEINLVWTFWQHKRPDAEEWPAGKDAQASFTVESASATTLRVRATVRSGDWSEILNGPEVALVPGKPTVITFPLPEAPATAPIENVRVIFNSFERIPDLKITQWSVGRAARAPAASSKASKR